MAKKIIMAGFILISFLLTVNLVFAQTSSTPTVLNVQVPFGSIGSQLTIGPNTIGEYIKAIIAFASAIIIIIAIVMIMISGVEWIMSAGDSGKVGKAKDRVLKAITGLVIALFAIFILQLVNPQTTIFNPLNPESIPASPSGTTSTSVTEDCIAILTQTLCTSPCIWTGTRCSAPSSNPQVCPLNTDKGTCDASSSLGCVWAENAFCGLKANASIQGSNPCAGNDQTTCSNANCQWNSSGGCTDQASQSTLTCASYKSGSTCPTTVCYWKNSTCSEILTIGSNCNTSDECGSQAFCHKADAQHDNKPYCAKVLSPQTCCSGVTNSLIDDDRACSTRNCSLVGTMPGCLYKCI
jgi:hypothetical protein